MEAEIVELLGSIKGILIIITAFLGSCWMLLVAIFLSLKKESNQEN